MSRLTKTIVGTNAVTVEGFEDGDYYAKTTYYDDKSLDRNNKIRNSGMLDCGRFGLHDKEDLRMVISCPSTLQWAVFCKKNPETYKLIKSTNEVERIKGARQLHILEPDWVVMDRL